MRVEGYFKFWLTIFLLISAAKAATNSVVIVGVGFPRGVLTGTVLSEDDKSLTIDAGQGPQTIARTNVLFLRLAQSPSASAPPPPAVPASTNATVETKPAPTNAAPAAAASPATNELCFLNGLLTTNQSPGEVYLGVPVKLTRLNCATNPPVNFKDYTAWLKDTNRPAGFTEWYYQAESNRLEKFFIPAAEGPVRAAAWPELRALLMRYPLHKYETNEYVGRHYAKALIAAAREAGFAAWLFRYGVGTNLIDCVQFPTTDSGFVLIDVTQYPDVNQPVPYLIREVALGQPVQIWPVASSPPNDPLPDREERARRRAREEQPAPVTGIFVQPAETVNPKK